MTNSEPIKMKFSILVSFLVLYKQFTAHKVNIDDCLIKGFRVSVHGIEGIAENRFASSGFWVIRKWRYYFSVFLGHSRWRAAYM